MLPDSRALELFALAALALLVVPGPAVLYVVVQSAEQGRRAGLASVAGLHLGTLVHVAAAAVGVSALVATSALAFSLVKYGGAAYLVYLGVRRLLDGRAFVPQRAAPKPLRSAFARGVVVNVLNPKTALFFLAFLPQFVDPGRGEWSQVVALGLVFVALGLISDSLWALVAGSISTQLRRHRSLLRYGSGSIYIGLGAAAGLVKRT